MNISTGRLFEVIRGFNAMPVLGDTVSDKTVKMEVGDYIKITRNCVGDVILFDPMRKGEPECAYVMEEDAVAYLRPVDSPLHLLAEQSDG